MNWPKTRAIGAISFLLASCNLAANEGDSLDSPSAKVGLKRLTSKQYLPADFDRATFEVLWSVWPEPARTEAANATPEQRRQLILARYGLHERPGWGGDLSDPPAGYVSSDSGWAMNCFTCHAGSIAGGETIYGLGNAHFAMHSFVRDRFAARIRQFRRPTGIEIGSQFVPLNATDGKTNAVIFGIAVGATRDKDLNVSGARPEALDHHDMDAPPWWHAKKKSTLYCDAYVAKTHRVIMPFVMARENDGPTVRGWENDFRHVLAFIESVEPPSYPFEIDHKQARRGQHLFESRCSACHGTYGDNWTYPERVIAIDEIATDPVRLNALTPDQRLWSEQGWLGRYGKDKVVAEPVGYLAPPLDGIWASAPYLHNGSVPTLWHLMHPEQRPSIWRRTRDGYDTERVGLELVSDGDVIPPEATEAERRRYYNATRRGMSNGGHRFFDDLSEADKADLLEYLKTL